MYGQITQIQSYEYEDLPIYQNQDRMEYLNRLIFYKDRVYDLDPNPLQDKYLEQAFGYDDETISKFQKLREEFYEILQRWGNYEFSFTEEMMKKYTPIYKGVAAPFKNVGHPNLSTFESRFGGSSKYYGLSHGRSLQEFIKDAKNPANRVSILTEEEAVNRGLLPGREETPESVPAEPILNEQVIQVDIPKNVPAQTEPIGIAEKVIELQLDEPLATQQTSYFLIGMVAVLIVSLGFLLRGRK